MLREQLPRGRLRHGTTAEGDHPALGQRLGDGGALEVAEVRLPVLLEDGGDGPVRGDDALVGVDEGDAEPTRDASSDAGLAGGHRAHQHQRQRISRARHAR